MYLIQINDTNNTYLDFIKTFNFELKIEILRLFIKKLKIS